MAGGSGQQACAACKCQRRKCQPDCVLARYFPADKSQAFRDVRRLFGVSNLIKFYSSVPPEMRDALVESMTCEAEMWRLDPVFGPVAVIRELRSRRAAVHRELAAARHQLALYRQQQDPFLVSHPHSSPPLTPLSRPQDFPIYQPPPSGFVNLLNGGVSAVGKMDAQEAPPAMWEERADLKPFNRAASNHAMYLLRPEENFYNPEIAQESKFSCVKMEAFRKQSKLEVIKSYDNDENYDD